MLGKPLARHQWLRLKEAMIEAGLDINDDEKLKLVAQIKAGGAMTKTNAVILHSVMKWLMDLERLMLAAGEPGRSSSRWCRGVIIWELQNTIIADRIEAGELDKEPADSARYNWFHICCPDRQKGYDLNGKPKREGYSANTYYTRDETYALIIKAATFVNKLRRQRSADPDTEAVAVTAIVV